MCFTLFLLIGCGIFNAFGQSKVYHELLNSRNGVNVDEINDIISDQLGYLWIAGNNLNNREIIAKSSALPLQRFDGTNFHDVQLNTALNFTDITKVTVYNDSTLILHSINNQEERHLTFFNTSTFEFKDLDISALGDVSDVRWIDGKMYLLTTRGTTVEVYTLTHQFETKFEFSFENQVNAIDVEPGTVFLSLNDIFLFSDYNFPITITDKKGNVLKKYSYDAFNRMIGSTPMKLWIENAFITHDKLYAFMRGDDHLYVFNEETLEFDQINDDRFLGKINVSANTDDNGNALITYNIGETLYLATLNKNSEIISLYSHEAEVFKGLRVYTQNIYDEVWIGTGNNLHYYKFPNQQFDNFIIDKQLRAIAPLGQDKFMVATEESGWYTYNHEKKIVTPFTVYENEFSIDLNSSRNILVDKDTLWSNSYGNIVAVHKQNGGSRSYRYFPPQCLEALNDSIIVYGIKDLDLMTFNKKTKKHKTLVKNDSLDLLDIAIDPKKEWIITVTDQGVLSYNVKSERSKFHNTGDLNNYFLTADYFENYGFLLGTRDGLVIQFDPAATTTQLFYKDDLEAGIATITPFGEDLWISTFNGLVHFEPGTRQVNRYSVKDGLSHNEGNRYSAARTSDGILVGSLYGLNHFVPDQLFSKQSQDSIRLLKIKKFDTRSNDFVEIFDQSAFAKANPIRLPVENKSLELDFSLTGLNMLRNESFEYQLDDQEWMDFPKKKRLQFLNLAAGDYVLKIRARDFSGRIIGKPYVLSIISENFFYNKWWFYAILIAFVFFLMFWLFRTQRIREKMQIQFSRDLIQSQEKERSRISKELHDSIGQHLTLIKQTAQNEDLNHIACFANTALEEVRSISRDIYPANLHRLGFKASVEQFMEDVDEQTPMFVDVEIDDVDHFMDQKTSLNLYRFIQEAVSNVIKHAQAKTLQVKITTQKEDLRIYIMDNGVGFEEVDVKGNTLGFKTLKERINIINGTLEILSVPGKGTRLLVLIPKMK